MKYEIKSMNTKRALSDSLKRIMQHKKLSKVTVSEIIADCGVNRKTFYYHFKDIYDLLKWTIEQETIEGLKNFDLLLNLEEAMSFVADYVDNNQHLLNCIYDSMGRIEIKRFFYTDFYNVILSAIEKLEKEMNKSLSASFKKQLTNFYTEALAGLVLDYFQHRDECDRDELIKYTVFILKNSIPNIIREAKTQFSV